MQRFETILKGSGFILATQAQSRPFIRSFSRFVTNNIVYHLESQGAQKPPYQLRNTETPGIFLDPHLKIQVRVYRRKSGAEPLGDDPDIGTHQYLKGQSKKLYTRDPLVALTGTYQIPGSTGGAFYFVVKSHFGFE